MTSIDALTEFATTADEKFVAYCKDLEGPFIHNYPKNCCKLVSVHLGLVLAGANPGMEVQVVRAYHRHSDEWHYWVEVESLVVDLTAHQFEGYRGPLVCAKPNPLEIRFPDVERISASDAGLDAQFETNPQIERILAVFTSYA